MDIVSSPECPDQAPLRTPVVNTPVANPVITADDDTAEEMMNLDMAPKRSDVMQQQQQQQDAQREGHSDSSKCSDKHPTPTATTTSSGYIGNDSQNAESPTEQQQQEGNNNDTVEGCASNHYSDDSSVNATGTASSQCASAVPAPAQQSLHPASSKMKLAALLLYSQPSQRAVLDLGRREKLRSTAATTVDDILRIGMRRSSTVAHRTAHIAHCKEADPATKLIVDSYLGHREGVQRCIEALELQQRPLDDILDGNGGTALHQAAAQGHRDTCLLLINHGMKCSSQRLDDGATPFHAAAKNGRKEVILLLLGTDPTAATIRNKKGELPIADAQTMGHFECCQLLSDIVPSVAGVPVKILGVPSRQKGVTVGGVATSGVQPPINGSVFTPSIGVVPTLRVGTGPTVSRIGVNVLQSPATTPAALPSKYIRLPCEARRMMTISTLEALGGRHTIDHMFHSTAVMFNCMWQPAPAFPTQSKTLGGRAVGVGLSLPSTTISTVRVARWSLRVVETLVNPSNGKMLPNLMSRGEVVRILTALMDSLDKAANDAGGYDHVTAADLLPEYSAGENFSLLAGGGGGTARNYGACTVGTIVRIPCHIFETITSYAYCDSYHRIMQNVLVDQKMRPQFANTTAVDSATIYAQAHKEVCNRLDRAHECCYVVETPMEQLCQMHPMIVVQFALEDVTKCVIVEIRGGSNNSVKSFYDSLSDLVWCSDRGVLLPPLKSITTTASLVDSLPPNAVQKVVSGSLKSCNAPSCGGEWEFVSSTVATKSDVPAGALAQKRRCKFANGEKAIANLTIDTSTSVMMSVQHVAGHVQAAAKPSVAVASVSTPQPQGLAPVRQQPVVTVMGNTSPQSAQVHPSIQVHPQQQQQPNHQYYAMQQQTHPQQQQHPQQQRMQQYSSQQLPAQESPQQFQTVVLPGFGQPQQQQVSVMGNATYGAPSVSVHPSTPWQLQQQQGSQQQQYATIAQQHNAHNPSLVLASVGGANTYAAHQGVVPQYFQQNQQSNQQQLNYSPMLQNYQPVALQQQQLVNAQAFQAGSLQSLQLQAQQQHVYQQQTLQQQAMQAMQQQAMQQQAMQQQTLQQQQAMQQALQQQQQQQAMQQAMQQQHQQQTMQQQTLQHQLVLQPQNMMPQQQQSQTSGPQMMQQQGGVQQGNLLAVQHATTTSTLQQQQQQNHFDPRATPQAMSFGDNSHSSPAHGSLPHHKAPTQQQPLLPSGVSSNNMSMWMTPPQATTTTAGNSNSSANTDDFTRVSAILSNLLPR